MIILPVAKNLITVIVNNGIVKATEAFSIKL